MKRRPSADKKKLEKRTSGTITGSATEIDTCNPLSQPREGWYETMLTTMSRGPQPSLSDNHLVAPRPASSVNPVRMRQPLSESVNLSPDLSTPIRICHPCPDQSASFGPVNRIGCIQRERSLLTTYWSEST